MNRPARLYWDDVASAYQRSQHISCTEFHYGPLIPGDREYGLLPPRLDGWRCLECGCGAAQNSIVLAARGAQCTAMDISYRQLRRGQTLARRHGVAIRFVLADLESLPLAATAAFDLVHSVYALPFLRHPQAAVAAMARLLRPGGVLVLSTAHPLAAGEWLTVDGEPGMFLPSYFAPPVDRRLGGGGEAVCRAVPVSTVFAWLRGAGLTVDAFLEPPALPVKGIDSAARRERMPYWSRGWLAAANELARVPVVAVFRAVKP